MIYPFNMSNKTNSYINSLILCTVLLCISDLVFAQNDTSRLIGEKMANYQKYHYQERLFVHTDKTFYVAGEEVWMKFYVTDALLHKPSGISKLVYLEIINNKKQSVLHAKIQLAGGFGDGNIKLPESVLSGNYTLRAYTQWMRNEGPDAFFEQAITIVNTINEGAKSPNFPIKSHIDFQFFPEGGHLLEGVENKIAFKAIDENELGVDCSGIVLNERNDTIVKFVSFKMGMGHFIFKPKNSELYRAFVKIGDSLMSPMLPIIQKAGYTMQIFDTNSDKLNISIHQLGGAVDENVYLLLHGPQFTGKSLVHKILNGNTVFDVDKSDLKEGVNGITIFNSSLQPVSERSYFKFPSKRLSIQLNTSQEIYSKKSEIQLGLLAKTNLSEQLSSNLSLSVFLIDSIQTPYAIQDIESYLMLSKEMNGLVQSAASYFDDTKHTIAEREAAIDNLMLTQGWSRYDWKDVFGPAKPTMYFPELEGPLVRAKITYKNNGLPANQVLTYFSIPGKPFYFATAKSNQNGDLLFNVKADIEANDVIVQAKPSADTAYRVSIIDAFDTRLLRRSTATFALPKNFKWDLLNRSIASQAATIFKKNIDQDPADSDTLAFFGKPSNSYYLDAYTRFTSMEELTKEYVQEIKVKKKGENISLVVWNNRFQLYNEGPPFILVDGVPIFNTNTLFSFDPLKIAKIDLITETNLTGNLFSNGIISYNTYNGDLAGFPIDANALVMEYEGAQSKRKFYSPSYPNTMSQKTSFPDLRNVLLWSPTIIVNLNTQKQIQFYSSDLPGKYAIVAQGLTSNGQMGSSIKYITIR